MILKSNRAMKQFDGLNLESKMRIAVLCKNAQRAIPLIAILK